MWDYLLSRGPYLWRAGPSAFGYKVVVFRRKCSIYNRSLSCYYDLRPARVRITPRLTPYRISTSQANPVITTLYELELRTV